MTERKRLSKTDTSPVNNSKKIKLIQTTIPIGTSTRPLCKYGAKCYRKHADHLRAYRHPSTSKKEEEQKTDNDEDDNSSTFKPTTTFVPSPLKKISPTNSSSSSPVKYTTASSNTTISLMELAELTGEKLLSHLYQMEFTTDLYEFWKFCSNINKKNPRGKK
jgi:hypothetical protein